MRLLFLNRSFWPDVEATGQLLTELCTDLAREHEVTVVAGPSYHVATSQRGLFGCEPVGGVRVVRTWGTTLPKRHLTPRLVNLGTYYLLAAIAAWRSERPDVIIAETDPPLLGLLGAFLKRRHGCRFVYYCQDVYPDVAHAVGGLHSPTLLSVLRRANRLAYDHADSIVVVGRDMRQRIIDKGVASDKVVALPNWADCDAIRVPESNGFRRQFGDRFVVMYSGNLGLAQQLDVALEAAAAMQDDHRVLFVLIGEGAAKMELASIARRRGLQNVRFLPYQAKDRLGESLGAADIHLIPLRQGAAGCVVPSKVYGILASGRPFVAMMEEDAEVARLAKEFSVGFVVPPADTGALVALIRRLVDSPAMLDDMGRRARRLAVERFDRRLMTRRFAELLDEVRGMRGAECGMI
jgi:glycosyltransferase involved in cell wall biosynthesis